MSEAASLQWGGRFAMPPDAALLAFGSSLEDDMVLAAFDVRGSRAHVASLAAGDIITAEAAAALDAALALVGDETLTGDFAAWARASGAEDVHGAIDARVRELQPDYGEWLHAGRSRNDQVATALALYARDRAERGRRASVGIARHALAAARAALEAKTVLAATTHWQPAQPILLAFWLEAIAEMFARAARRFARTRDDASVFSPLGAGACSGSTLPLDRERSARELRFGAPSRNALDTVGDRDVSLDLLHAVARALVAASRISEELVLWCTPAFGYATLEDAASTGSSLMPQKRNPDPFELVRANASRVAGAYAGALASTTGVALSYHRDLQETKSLVLRGTERGLAALDAFASAFTYTHWNADAMERRANDGYVVATDIADALIVRGVTARAAHVAVGAAVREAAAANRRLNADDLVELATRTGLPNALEAPLDAQASVRAKRTAGSTHPHEVRRAIEALDRELGTI